MFLMVGLSVHLVDGRSAGFGAGGRRGGGRF